MRNDIAAGVNFAREHNLRLVVKGGGHSYQGTSCAPDSLLIWTRHMNDIVLHQDFVPQGCAGKVAAQPAVTLGAGAIWIHAYDAVTTKAGQYVQGGGCTTVGVAGLVQSGGFGSFSKHYGTAAAGLLEAEVVTADGKIRIANACTNPDLFWALKGGGGGSFGVVSKVTVRVRELAGIFWRCPPRYQGEIARCLPPSGSPVRRFYREQLFNDHWGEQAHIRADNVLQIRMAHQGFDTQQVKAIWQPFLDWVARSPKDYSVLPQPILVSLPARDLWNVDFMQKRAPGVFTQDSRPGASANDVWWTGDGDQAGQVLYGYESQWLPASLLENGSQDALANALFECSRHWDVELHFNKGLAGAPADAIAAARDTATNPAVLDAFALAIIAGGTNRAIPGVPGHEPDYKAARERCRTNACAMNELRKVAPAPGSYVSESNFFQQRMAAVLLGTNYPRLRQVKAKYDPSGLFFVHHGVGSEDWSDDGFARRRS